MERQHLRPFRKNVFFKMVREPIRGIVLLFWSSAMYLVLCMILFFDWNALDYSSSALAVSLFLAAVGILEAVFSWRNRLVFESWGLFMQGSFLPVAAALLLSAEAEAAETMLSAYLGVAGAFNIVLAMALSQYGMADWKGAVFLNSAVSFATVSNFFIIEIPIFLPAMLAATASARILIGIGIDKLNSFPGKVSRQIYAKIETVKEEYAGALEKNWDADEKLYL